MVKHFVDDTKLWLFING